jgi:hypothetical protein
MSDFKMEVKDSEGTDFITLCGVIDEEAKFKVPPKKSSSIALDLESVEYINSCGIREWINWMNDNLGHYNEVHIHNCPHHIIEVANVVNSFFTDKCKVFSFYAPYYVQDVDDVFYKLFEKSADFPSCTLELPEKLDTPNGEGELDIIADKFLKFLGQYC